MKAGAKSSDARRLIDRFRVVMAPTVLGILLLYAGLLGMRLLETIQAGGQSELQGLHQQHLESLRNMESQSAVLGAENGGVRVHREPDWISDPHRQALVAVGAALAIGSVWVFLVVEIICRRLKRLLSAFENAADVLNGQRLASARQAAVRELASGVAQGINNALQIILVEKAIIDQYLKQGPPLTPAQWSGIRESSKIITDQVGRARAITRGMLRFTDRAVPSQAAPRR